MNEARELSIVWSETPGRRRVSLAFALSVVAHAAATLWLLAPVAAPFSSSVAVTDERANSSKPSQKGEVFVDVLPHQLVESEVADNGKVPADARFHGKRNQVVEEQTRAPVVGSFRVGSGETGTTLSPSIGLEGEHAGLSMKDLGFSDKPFGVLEGAEGGMSASDDRLDGIRTGTRTLLTTRESKYFSFFERAKRQLKAQWENELAERVAAPEARVQASQRSRWSTRVVATLDAEGRVLDVAVTRASGLPLMDEAARQAFFRVAMLHNPPKGMFQEEGRLLLPWEFNVDMRHMPNAIARSANQGDERVRRME